MIITSWINPKNPTQRHLISLLTGNPAQILFSCIWIPLPFMGPNRVVFRLPASNRIVEFEILLRVCWVAQLGMSGLQCFWRLGRLNYIPRHSSPYSCKQGIKECVCVCVGGWCQHNLGESFCSVMASGTEIGLQVWQQVHLLRVYLTGPGFSPLFPLSLPFVWRPLDVMV